MAFIDDDKVKQKTKINGVNIYSFDKINELIVKYKVTGVKEFEDVLKSALGEVITNDEIQYPENDLDGEITLLKKCWRKSKEIMDGAVSAEKRVTAISKLGDTGGKLLDFIDSVI